MRLVTEYRACYEADFDQVQYERFNACCDLVRQFCEYMMSRTQENRGTIAAYKVKCKDTIDQTLELYLANPCADHWNLNEQALLAYQHICKNVKRSA